MGPFLTWFAYDMHIDNAYHDFSFECVLNYNHNETELFETPCARHNHIDGPSYTVADREERILTIDEALEPTPLPTELVLLIHDYTGLITPCWFHGPATPYVVVATEKRRAWTHVNLYCPIQHKDREELYTLPTEIQLDHYNRVVAEFGVAAVRVLTRTKINAKKCLPVDCVSDSDSDGTHSLVVSYSHVLLAVDWGEDGTITEESEDEY